MQINPSRSIYYLINRLWIWIWAVPLQRAGPTAACYLCVNCLCLVRKWSGQGWMESDGRLDRAFYSISHHLIASLAVICHPVGYLFSGALSQTMPYWETWHSAQPEGQHLPAGLGIQDTASWWAFALDFFALHKLQARLLSMSVHFTCSLHGKLCYCMPAIPFMSLLKSNTLC